MMTLLATNVLIALAVCALAALGIAMRECGARHRHRAHHSASSPRQRSVPPPSCRPPARQRNHRCRRRDGDRITIGMVSRPDAARTSHMHPVAVFIGVLFFGWLWGGWGLLLGVPILTVLKSIADRVESMQPISELLRG
jgi:hypothetical protein